MYPFIYHQYLLSYLFIIYLFIIYVLIYVSFICRSSVFS